MPAPRDRRADEDRSNTRTSQPEFRSPSAAVRPPSEPPMTMTLGIRDTSRAPSHDVRQRRLPLRAAERRDLHDIELEQHPALVERWITEAVWRLVPGVLHPDPVQLGGDARALGRVIAQ